MAYQVYKTLLIMRMAPISAFHHTLAITHFVDLKSSMEPLTIEQSHMIRQIEKNKSV